MIIKPETIKKRAHDAGADLCGIASVESFSDAPRGFHPKDIFPGTKSVIVIAKRFPAGAMKALSPVPYTFSTEQVLSEVYQITITLMRYFESENITAVPVPSVPYEYWDEENLTGKGIMSLRHAGYFAGIGTFGKNSLIYNRKFGNCITLGALLTDADIHPDTIITGNMCPEGCSVCMDSCPAGALTATGVIQARCRPHSTMVSKRGDTLYTCHLCRSRCPNSSSVVTTGNSEQN